MRDFIGSYPFSCTFRGCISPALLNPAAYLASLHLLRVPRNQRASVEMGRVDRVFLFCFCLCVFLT